MSPFSLYVSCTSCRALICQIFWTHWIDIFTTFFGNFSKELTDHLFFFYPLSWRDPTVFTFRILSPSPLVVLFKPIHNQLSFLVIFRSLSPVLQFSKRAEERIKLQNPFSHQWTLLVSSTQKFQQSLILPKEKFWGPQKSGQNCVAGQSYGS